ncbi:MAG TPA: sigma-70 family RNA polymerase sigma factor, partial [Bryobacteraceae bacterium]|nr:sigma-70 family RNA polymerase sigma factor [Bryobacteraceae bacterium]
DDAVQDTMIRACRNLEQFDGRSQVRTWLYRIATNVCLDELNARTRRARPVEDGPMGSVDSVLLERPREHWLEPVADAKILPADADPSELAILRQSIRLAFVAALQYLPPKQRAALLLVEVLGWSAADVAENLDMSVASVNSALQRARATVASRRGTAVAPVSQQQAQLVDQYADAFQRYDVDALVSMLHQDATLSMPPFALWLQGPDTIREWLLGRGAGCRGSRLIPVEASGSPAFGQYRPNPAGGFSPWALIVLELAGDRILALNSFLDTETLFPRFGLSAELPE